jgi:hypothetical protein
MCYRRRFKYKGTLIITILTLFTIFISCIQKTAITHRHLPNVIKKGMISGLPCHRWRVHIFLTESMKLVLII